MKKKIRCEHGKCRRAAIVVVKEKFYCSDCYLFAKGINLRNVKAISDTNNSRRIH